MAQMTTETHSGSPHRKARTHRVSDSLPGETLITWLRDMLLIREFENRCAQAYQQAKIGGFCHLYTGQEAVAVGTIQSLERDDPIVTAYRPSSTCCSTAAMRPTRWSAASCRPGT